jgi:hypothetical protein
MIVTNLKLLLASKAMSFAPDTRLVEGQLQADELVICYARRMEVANHEASV